MCVLAAQPYPPVLQKPPCPCQSLPVHDQRLGWGTLSARLPSGLCCPVSGPCLTPGTAPQWLSSDSWPHLTFHGTVVTPPALNIEACGGPTPSPALWGPASTVPYSCSPGAAGIRNHRPETAWLAAPQPLGLLDPGDLARSPQGPMVLTTLPAGSPDLHLQWLSTTQNARRLEPPGCPPALSPFASHAEASRGGDLRRCCGLQGWEGWAAGQLPSPGAWLYLDLGLRSSISRD